MVSSVNPYPPSFTLSTVGNASMDYLNLALVVETSRNLQAHTREFIYSYDPHKLYLNIQNINNKSPEGFVSTYA